MLITEKMQQTAFSPSEKILIDYILKQRQEIKNKTTKQISLETYTNPSMLVRIAKKLGYDGWTELKHIFLEEIKYLDSHFENIDANIPFENQDNVMTIASKMAMLNQATINDTLSLIQYETLQKAVLLLTKASNIKIFTNNENVLISQDFVLRMNRIGQHTTLCMTGGEQVYEACTCNIDTCAILISYTGETDQFSKITSILKKRKIPIIAMTSIGQSALADHADCVLRITTREKLYSKISSFTTTTSICYLLDVLYSCVFSQDYDGNLKRKIAISKMADRRKTSSKIIEES